MAVMDGCKSKTTAVSLEERDCPVCGEPIEVVIRMGRIIEDAECECGYVIKSEGEFTYKTRFDLMEEEK